MRIKNLLFQPLSIDLADGTGLHIGPRAIVDVKDAQTPIALAILVARKVIAVLHDLPAPSSPAAVLPDLLAQNPPAQYTAPIGPDRDLAPAALPIQDNEADEVAASVQIADDEFMPESDVNLSDDNPIEQENSDQPLGSDDEEEVSPKPKKRSRR